jgi:phospholipase/carboxylesterase
MAATLIPSTLAHKVVHPNSGQPSPYPTLILLHGRGANEDDLLGLVPHLDPRLFVISVRAPFAFPYGGWTWYDILEVGSPHPPQFDESYHSLVQFLGDVQRGYPVDPNAIFLLGFSMGAVMSFALSLTRPEEIAGVVAHSGYVPEQSSLSFARDKLQRTSFFVAHGEHDPVIPVQFGRRAHELLTAAGTDVTYREYPIAHQISEASLSDLAGWLRQRLESGARKVMA